jgi:hypothetical protein
MSALLIAKHLGKRIAVIDSECGSASKYAGDVADFDTLELDQHSPRHYIAAIKSAESEGYDVIVIDSLTHAWTGKGGALEMVDAAAKRSKSGNSFTAWRDVTPEHNAMVDALVACKAHLIVTMRAKTEYILQDNGKGKQMPTKVGMAPIQRDGLEFEMDVVAEMDLEHNFMVSKTRCSKLDGAVINRPGEQVATALKAWLNDGVEVPASASVVEHSSNGAHTPTADVHPPVDYVGNAACDAASAKPYTFDQHIANLERIGHEKLQGWVTKLFTMSRTAEQDATAWASFTAKCLVEGKDPNSYLPAPA